MRRVYKVPVGLSWSRRHEGGDAGREMPVFVGAGEFGGMDDPGPLGGGRFAYVGIWWCDVVGCV